VCVCFLPPANDLRLDSLPHGRIHFQGQVLGRCEGRSVLRGGGEDSWLEALDWEQGHSVHLWGLTEEWRIGSFIPASALLFAAQDSAVPTWPAGPRGVTWRC
jgi:hypothetical protein